jgi:hypothetical protein
LEEAKDVRFGSKADICSAKRHVRFAPNSDRKSGFPHKVMSALPPKRTCAVQLEMSAMGHKQTLDPLLDHFVGAIEESLGNVEL